MKIFSKVISLVLVSVLALGGGIEFPSNAADDVVFQELIALGKDAENFARMMTDDFTMATLVIISGCLFAISFSSLFIVIPLISHNVRILSTTPIINMIPQYF